AGPRVIIGWATFRRAQRVSVAVRAQRGRAVPGGSWSHGGAAGVRPVRSRISTGECTLEVPGPELPADVDEDDFTKEWLRIVPDFGTPGSN
ncbi:MAG TPA: hypothetical protein VFV89_10275, partial [Nocardioides sp.]|uniref:hypothetical protein n=1 Tax=Nocardioides sp. TaxID=35761 RepID=UPI002E34C97D